MKNDIESLMSRFQGGLDYGSVNGEDFIKMFKDFLDIANYKNDINERYHPYDKPEIIEDNNNFWKAVLNNKLRIGNRIVLRDFDIMEWLPVSPGLYFTEDAISKRAQAKEWFNFKQKEFLPVGKMEMIRGGVGSVRLSPSHDDCFMCATSNGISHQGIPIIVRNRELNRIIDEIKYEGAIRADILGTIQILPQDKSLIRFDRNIPKYVIRVEDIQPLRENIMFHRNKGLIVSVAIMFPSNSYGNKDDVFTLKKEFLNRRVETSFKKLYSFCSFNPKDNCREIPNSIHWLIDYCNRHSDITDPPILNDFDEHYNHFDNYIEFPLSKISKNQIDKNHFMEYINYYQINIGNNFEFNANTQNFKDSTFNEREH